MTDAINLGFLRKFIKTKDSESKEAEMELRQLYEERSRVREELEIAMKNYDHVTEDGLMDFYIYKIRSQQVLEQYLIREIRRLEKENKSA